MHKHHITLTYRDPNSSVTVEVSVTCHAMFHWCEWQLHSDKRDWLAWKGLCGEISKEEIVRQLRSEGGRKGGAKAKGRTDTWSHLHVHKATEAGKSPKSIAKRKATFKNIKHQQGAKNSQFGTRWITDGVSSRKLAADALLPKGWRYGRTRG